MRPLAELKIELTQECPLACVHCSTRSDRFAKTLLPSEVVSRLLHEARNMGTRKVAFSGGEPLVYPRLGEVLLTACSLEFASTLYTTGLKNNNLEPLNSRDVSNLVSAGLRRIVFSVYAVNPAIHNSLTGFPSYEPTMQAINACVSGGLCVEFHFVPLRRNYAELDGVIELAARLGVSTVSVLRFVPQGRGASIRESEDLRAEDYRRFRQSIRKPRSPRTVGLRLGAPMNILGLGHTCCDVAQDIMLVNYRGQVRPCDAFKDTDYPDDMYGSILNKPLNSVWEKSEFLNAARLLHSERRNACKSCPTGCLAQEALHEGGIQNLVRRSNAHSTITAT
jgi:radical SAM protein with 4Fe4S-binding SPASM domain